MNIGILGSGHIAMAIAGHATGAGYPVMISRRGDPESLAPNVATLGPSARAGSFQNAVEFGDIVFIAVVWDAVPAVTAQIPTWDDKIVVDPTNPLRAENGGITVLEYAAATSSEVIADLVPGARLVKGFCTYTAADLAADPQVDGWRRVMMLAGDDNAAKLAVAALTSDMGFAPVDAGTLVDGGGKFQVGGPLRAQLRGF